ARRGQPVVIRQTLAGSSYGLLDEATLEPRPDYWASVVWKRQMGAEVLDATVVGGGGFVRAYAHAAKGRAGATAVVLNLLNERSLNIRFDGAADDEAWLFTAKSIDSR